jgi:hypothetical protein
MAEAKSKKTEANKKIVDVKLGGDGATGTSRPVIVTNRPILKDPMMAEVSQLTGGAMDDSQIPTPTGDASVDPPSGAPELTASAKKVAIKTEEAVEPAKVASEPITPATAPSKKKIVIKPLSEEPPTKPAKATKTEPTVADLAKPDIEEVADIPDITEAVAAPAQDEPTDVTEETTEATEEPNEAPDEVPANQDDAVPAVQPGRSFDESEQAAKDTGTSEPEEIELDAKGKPKGKTKRPGELTSEQQKAIQNEEYFLPITTAETRRIRREIVLATLFVTILIVAWLDIMLDADLLSIGGIKAVTHFF